MIIIFLGRTFKDLKFKINLRTLHSLVFNFLFVTTYVKISFIVIIWFSKTFKNFSAISNLSCVFFIELVDVLTGFRFEAWAGKVLRMVRLAKKSKAGQPGQIKQ